MNLKSIVTPFACVLGISMSMLTGSAFADNTTTIAFGSCASQHMPQPIWHDIAKHQPDVFLFIGDNQYADIKVEDGKEVYAPVADPKRFAEAYQELNEVEAFTAFRKRVPIFMGTWDDHDYGANDAGKDYPLKMQSQAAFLDFFEFAKDDPIRKQAGIYHSRIVEQAGARLQIIMLDTRYHLGERLENPKGRPQGKGPYLPQTDATKSILGEEQWLWLEGELKKPADIRFIVSSIQVVAFEHSWEAWGAMPRERKRLYDLIARTKANGVMFLSGDRHLMEISKDTGQLGHSVPYPLWDFTSSGLTQSFREVDEHNSFRQGTVVRDTHYGVVTVNWDRKNMMQTTIELHALGLDQRTLEKKVVSLSSLQF